MTTKKVFIETVAKVLAATAMTTETRTALAATLAVAFKTENRVEYTAALNHALALLD